MKRLVYAVVAVSALGLAAGGVALACEQHVTHNDQSTATQGKLAMATTPIAAPDRIVKGDDDEKSSDEKKGD